jgi:hypothetical protein
MAGQNLFYQPHILIVTQYIIFRILKSFFPVKYKQCDHSQKSQQGVNRDSLFIYLIIYLGQRILAI